MVTKNAPLQGTFYTNGLIGLATENAPVIARTNLFSASGQRSPALTQLHGINACVCPYSRTTASR